MPINFRISALVPVGLIVESVAQLDDSILVTARAGIQAASCPLCGSPSRRVHSRYVREVSDLPCSGRSVRLRVVIRRYPTPSIVGDGSSPNALTRQCFSSGHAGPAGWTASSIISG
jgi:hypothetical protein